MTIITDEVQPVRVTKPGMNPLFIIGALFFVFGFITWLSSVLIPYLQIACELNNFESYLVAFSFYVSYLVMAIPSGWFLKLTGFKNGMSYGLLIIAVGSLIFIPAALTRTYGLFLFGLFVQGTGLAVLQTASNPYVAVLGPLESAARRISIMGICNGIAGAIAPVILGAVILSDADKIKTDLSALSAQQRIMELDSLAREVILPYVLIFLVLGALAFIVYRSSLPDIDTDTEDDLNGVVNMDKTSILQFPHLLLGVLSLFCYVGAEVIAGNTIVGYANWQGMNLSDAKFFTSLTLIGMLGGYFVGIVCIPRYVSQENALRISAVLGIILTLAVLHTNGVTSVLFVALLGIANSLIWPSIWPLAIADLGRFTKIGSSLLVMAIVGGAVIPLLYGYVADLSDLRTAYWLLVPCYSAVLFYALWGYKIRAVRNTLNEFK
jgi:glucose/galactose transporter